MLCSCCCYSFSLSFSPVSFSFLSFFSVDVCVGRSLYRMCTHPCVFTLNTSCITLQYTIFLHRYSLSLSLSVLSSQSVVLLFFCWVGLVSDPVQTTNEPSIRTIHTHTHIPNACNEIGQFKWFDPSSKSIYIYWTDSMIHDHHSRLQFQKLYKWPLHNNSFKQKVAWHLLIRTFFETIACGIGWLAASVFCRTVIRQHDIKVSNIHAHYCCLCIDFQR